LRASLTPLKGFCVIFLPNMRPDEPIAAMDVPHLVS
jgi:hypothetical protein